MSTKRIIVKSSLDLFVNLLITPQFNRQKRIFLQKSSYENNNISCILLAHNVLLQTAPRVLILSDIEKYKILIIK